MLYVCIGDLCFSVVLVDFESEDMDVEWVLCIVCLFWY